MIEENSEQNQFITSPDLPSDPPYEAESPNDPQAEAQRLKKVQYEKNTEGNKLIGTMEQISPGRKDWQKYENFCKDFLEFIFQNDLKEKPQVQITDLKDGRKIKKRRRDITISNTPLNSSSFWKDLQERDSKRERPFALGCESIIFECKNLSKSIVGCHVYQTYEYLDPGYRNSDPIGRLAFILTRVDASPSANRAIKRVKEDGYYIYVITDKIIRECLIPYFVENLSVENFFSEFIKKEAQRMG